MNDAGADLLPLNMLGESADITQPAMIEPLDLQEDASSGDFISQFEVMADPRFNYHFAYEGISESDESTSRRNSNSNKEDEEVGDGALMSNGNGHVSKYAAAIQTTDWGTAEVKLIDHC